jgi:hypothetical protein
MDQWESLLWALYSHELKLKELYQAFALRFNSQAAFWSQIAQEEQEHAELVTRLRKKIKAGTIEFNPTTLKRQAVEASIARVDALIEKCGQGQLDLVKALAHALDLEQCLIERGFLQCLNYPLGGCQSVGVVLQEQTRQHIVSLRTKLAEAKHAR